MRLPTNITGLIDELIEAHCRCCDCLVSNTDITRARARLEEVRTAIEQYHQTPIPVTERLPTESYEMRWNDCPVVQAFIAEENGKYGCWLKAVYNPKTGDWWEDSSLEESLPIPTHWFPLLSKPQIILRRGESTEPHVIIRADEPYQPE